MKSYITLLSTDSYLDGVLALVNSLRKTNPVYPILCLITPNVSFASILKLKDAQITLQPAELILHSGLTTYKRLNFTKLTVFGLEAYEKLVYLDCDMVILENIDELFDKPHMTACKAGNVDNWKHFNSGLVVIEPSMVQFKDMISKMDNHIGVSEQSFLQSYFTDWVSRPELHLPSAFNTLVGDAPLDLTGIKVLHYVGEHKPWTHFDDANHTHHVWKTYQM